VVDDEPDLADLYQSILTEEGYDVVSASNGVEALALLEHDSVELIISDVIMPEMDGGELSQKVHKLYPGIKIQLISGFNEDEQIRESELKTQILHKPIDAEDLLERVRDLLG